MLPVAAATIAVLCVVMLGADGLSGSESPQPATPQASVAVVDMAKLLHKSEEWQDLIAERKSMLDSRQRALDKLVRRVQVLRNEQEALPPGGEERRAKALEVQKAISELESTRRRYESEAAEQYSQAIRTMLGKVSRAVDAYAEEQGIQVVLKKQDLQLAGEQSLQPQLIMGTADVLYASPDLEITEGVIRKLNADYEGPIRVQ